MNERILYTALNTGLDYFKADGDRLEALFQDMGLGAAETAQLRAYFELDPDDGAHGGPPNLVHGYPRSSGPFPCWAIILLSDKSRQRLLGDDAGTHGAFDTSTDLDGNAAIEKARLADNVIAIDTYVPDLPDVCLYYYHLLRFIVFDNVDEMQRSPHYLQNIEFSGMDLQPNPQYLPENMWLRRLTVTFFTEEAAWEPKSEPTTIDGAFVNDGETQPGITKKVDPYQE